MKRYTVQLTHKDAKRRQMTGDGRMLYDFEMPNFHLQDDYVAVEYNVFYLMMKLGLIEFAGITRHNGEHGDTPTLQIRIALV